jgi:hypothetical protein
MGRIPKARVATQQRRASNHTSCRILTERAQQLFARALWYFSERMLLFSYMI